MVKKIFFDYLLYASINAALKRQKIYYLLDKLMKIVPDISEQRTYTVISGKYQELKARGQHAFQMHLFERAVRLIGKDNMTVVDIGDSAGTHLQYIKSLCSDINIRTISVDIDKKAVEKIQSKGMEAIHSAAEDLDLGKDTPIDLFVTFEMLEHLVNPCLFLHRMAVHSKSDYMVVTVPYRKRSRVAINYVRYAISNCDYNADIINTHVKPEQLHIFEFSPEDWKVIMTFCGWEVVDSSTYLQYPKWHVLYPLKYIWRYFDFEGFFGVVLKKNTCISDRYDGW